jgi:hypothetical protein
LICRTVKWLIVFAGAAFSQIPPELCTGKAVGLNLDPKWRGFPPPAGVIELTFPIDLGLRFCQPVTAGQACTAGTGSFQSTFKNNVEVREAMLVRVSKYATPVDSRKELRFRLFGFAKAGDASLALPKDVGDGGNIANFTVGPYFTRIQAAGSYVAKIGDLARSIERQLRQLPQTCDAATTTNPRDTVAPEASQVTCPAATDKATINLSWSPGKKVRDVTIRVGTTGGGDDIAIIGPINGTATYVNSIPPGKIIHVTLISHFEDGTEKPTKCSFESLGEAGVGLNMRIGGRVGASVAPVRLQSAAASPNSRTSNQQPELAIDRNISTYTWTTESWSNVQPSVLAVAFAQAAVAGRIRLYKDPDSGGAGPTLKDLIIEYTASPTSVPIGSRVWQRVSGLKNGFAGRELMKAAAVSPDGTVTGDRHDSLVEGWASLSFNPVTATAMRIRFSNPVGSPLKQNHYRVYEIEVYPQ